MSGLPHPGQPLREWGTGATINPDPSTFTQFPGSVTSQSLQAQIDPPSVFTVQFSISAPLVPTNSDNIPVAEIQFSCNGVTIRRKISIYNGASLSGPGKTVKVKMFDESDSVLRGPYNVSCTITVGTRASNDTPVLMNTDQQIINSTTSATFDIEDDAGANQVQFLIGPSVATDDLNPDNVLLIFIDVSGSTIGSTTWAPGVFFPIPPGTVQITVQNNDDDPIRARMVLGIDG